MAHTVSCRKEKGFAFAKSETRVGTEAGRDVFWVKLQEKRDSVTVKLPCCAPRRSVIQAGPHHHTHVPVPQVIVMEPTAMPLTLLWNSVCS